MLYVKNKKDVSIGGPYVKNQYTFTVYGTRDKGADTKFLIYFRGDWIWEYADKFIPVEVDR